MRKARLIWRIFPLFFAVTLMAIIAMGWVAARAVREASVEAEFAHLEAVARLADRLFAVDPLPAQDLLQRIASEHAVRITVLNGEGTPVEDSAQDPAHLLNQREAPEIASALQGTVGRSRRVASLGQEMLFVALPHQRDATTPGAVLRVGRPTGAIQAAMVIRQRQIFLACLVLTVIAAGLHYLVYRLVSSPLHSLRLGAERFARGDLDTRVPVPHSEELGVLAQSLNEMASQMQNRYASQTAHTYELEALLSSMVESVLAVDGETRILKLNPAAAALFKAPVAACEGRILQEVIRNRDLNEFVARTLKRDGVIEGEIVLFDGEERYLQAHGTPLRNAAGKSIGGVVVLNDVTRLRRLESARSEFAANVSHELRTPITSIIGYVETLQDGALESPEDAARFIAIIARQAQRLNALIEDLLALSRIERGGETGGIELTTAPLHEVLRDSLAECAARANENDIRLELIEEHEDLQAAMNAALLQQALVNLIDNAVAHSDAGGVVRVSARRDRGNLVIEVADEGCGIAKEHLPRLFERFYRVDEDRARRKGGTGLGLAIVKHVIRVHDGQVTVDSELGHGSTFRITLPDATEPPEGASTCPGTMAAAIIPPGDTDA